MIQTEGQRKVYLKIVQIARLRVRGLKDADIAKHFDLSQGGFARLVASDEYKRVEEEVLNQQVARLDKTGADALSALQKKFSSVGIPLAVQGLLDTAMQNRDLKAKLAACSELFDRDPNRAFAKGNVNPQGAQPLSDISLEQMSTDSSKVMSEVMGKPATERVQ
jgi:hypothetical protein